MSRKYLNVASEIKKLFEITILGMVTVKSGPQKFVI